MSTTYDDNKDEVPSIELSEVSVARVEPTSAGVSVEDPSIDLGEDSIDENQTVAPDEDPVFDPLFNNPVIEQIMRPFEEITNALHVAHGDQMTIADLIDGINKAAPDSIENEMFKELVKTKGVEKAMQWLASTQQSINHMAYQNSLTPTVMRENSQWLQGILINGHVIGAHRPDVKNKNSQHTPGSRLVGNEAMVRVRQAMGIGDFITLPCPHSGLWLTLLISGEDEMVNFHSRVLTSKSVMGRRTVGLVYSNTDVIILRHLWDLLASMIVNTSMGKVNKKELVNLIKVQDIPLIVAGYMAARYRSGYPLVQPCQVDPTKCAHIETSLVNINRMIIIDNAALSPVQRAHMARRAGHTTETVLAYQEQFAALSDNVRSLTDGVRVVFGMPSVEQKLVAGDAWINDIEDAVSLSFSDTMTRDERVAHINKQAAVSALRTYAHWVRRIDYLAADGTVDGFVEGDEDIYTHLTEMTRNAEVRAKFFEEVAKYINSVTVGIVALPRYVCKSCGQRQPAVGEKYPDFTPINLERCFFTLLGNTLNDSMATADI